MINPDPLKKTVKIPVRLVDGQVQYFYGGELPKITDTIGDLVIPAYALVDQAEKDRLSFEDVSELLPDGSILMINVRVDQFSDGVLTGRRNPKEKLPNASKEGYVRVSLLEPLMLWHRGTKKSVLCDCACHLSDIGVDAKSLNHAYTIASKRFETERISNSGNVFLHAYYKAENGWEQLEWLRERLDAKFEKQYISADTRVPEDLDVQAQLFELPAVETEYRSRAFRQPFRSDPKRPFFESGEYEVNTQEFDELLSEAWYDFNHRFWRYNIRGSHTALPLRICLKDFKQSKSQRRVMRINADLKVEELPVEIGVNPQEEQLFRAHRSRLVNAPEKLPLPKRNDVNKKFCVYNGQRLIAISYLEMGARSSYGYYAYFDPSIEWRSLGIFTMLLEIEYAISKGNEFYYLGYAFEETSRLDYKKRFHGLQSFDWHGYWQPYPRLTETTG